MYTIIPSPTLIPFAQLKTESMTHEMMSMSKAGLVHDKPIHPSPPSDMVQSAVIMMGVGSREELNA